MKELQITIDGWQNGIVLIKDLEKALLFNHKRIPFKTSMFYYTPLFSEVKDNKIVQRYIRDNMPEYLI